MVRPFQSTELDAGDAGSRTKEKARKGWRYMQAVKNVTVIPATRMMHTGLPRNAAVRKRVAGYARVSTDSEEQQTSYEAQVDYYSHSGFD